MDFCGLFDLIAQMVEPLSTFWAMEFGREWVGKAGLGISLHTILLQFIAQMAQQYQLPFLVLVVLFV